MGQTSRERWDAEIVREGLSYPQSWIYPNAPEALKLERLGSGRFGVVLRVYSANRENYVDVRVSAAGRKIEVAKW